MTWQTLTAFSLLCLTGFIGCTTGQMQESGAVAEGTAVRIERPYDQSIEEFSAGDSEYTGFYNNFEFKATLLNSAIRERTFKRQSEYFQWNEDKQASERAKYTQELSSGTEIFVSFFTPDRKNDNLAEDKPIWKVYLDVGGSRYEGKVKRIRTLLVELQSLYPYHTRWNTPYMFSFSVPTTAIESQPSKLTITGPLGTREVSFPAIN
ncbi:MAG TPA: hypothetical protein VM432_00355 [Bdellovibrionales bacterium]|jgi:hypothetical protein|nr:hypothetical protein [Bdellovibrionales bacterium]